jgi:hypothetical protein
MDQGHRRVTSRFTADPLDYIVDIKRRVNQTQVPLLNQSSPQTTLHLVTDSLSHRTLPERNLTEPFAILRCTQTHYTQGHGAEQQRWQVPDNREVDYLP